MDPCPMAIIPNRYEESSGNTLEKLNPVVAIGRPRDTLDFSGAARFYVSDDHWQQAVLYFMKHTSAVVYIVGETRGLW